MIEWKLRSTNLATLQAIAAMHVNVIGPLPARVADICTGPHGNIYEVPAAGIEGFYYLNVKLDSDELPPTPLDCEVPDDNEINEVLGKWFDDAD